MNTGQMTFKTLKLLFTALFFFALAMIFSGDAEARGQGPIGLWAASERYVLVADSSLPGVVLVDLTTGTAVERLVIENTHPKGIAACKKCDFAFLTAGKGLFWKIHFKDRIDKLLGEHGKLGLENAVLEPLNLKDADPPITDGRMCRMSDDGKDVFIASSDDRAVFRVNLAQEPKVFCLIKTQKKSVKPYGLNWGKNGTLLVSMHKREVWRINTKGKLLETYNTYSTGCPGAREFNPNLRAAIDDPKNENSIIVLASNPKSYDAVLWRFRYKKDEPSPCAELAGRIGRTSGWEDAVGKDIRFSRPHYFVLRPDARPDQLIISDIDNRALRLLNLSNDTSTTVMYDRDRRLNAIPLEKRTSSMPCQAKDWSDAVPATTAQGTPALVRPSKSNAKALTYAEAKAHCEQEGARLCDPVELRRSGIASASIAWTAAECASCWQRQAGMKCSADIDNHRDEGTHSTEGFTHSWNSGHAVEIGKNSPEGPATICPSADTTYRAETPCCVDCFE